MPKEESGTTKWEDLAKRLVAQSSKDSKFRAALMMDPKGAIEKELQIRLPKDVTISVHQETPTNFHLILPDLSVPNIVGKLTNPRADTPDGGTDSYRMVGGVRG